jgi:hypothetical protein
MAVFARGYARTIFSFNENIPQRKAYTGLKWTKGRNCETWSSSKIQICGAIGQVLF